MQTLNVKISKIIDNLNLAPSYLKLTFIVPIFPFLCLWFPRINFKLFQVYKSRVTMADRLKKKVLYKVQNDKLIMLLVFHQPPCRDLICVVGIIYPLILTLEIYHFLKMATHPDLHLVSLCKR